MQVLEKKLASAGLTTRTAATDVKFCAGDAVCVAPGHKLQDSGDCHIGPWGDASWFISAGPGVEGVVARVEGSEITVKFAKEKLDIDIKKRGMGNDPRIADTPLLKAKAHQLRVSSTRVVTCCIDKDELDPPGVKLNCFGLDGSLLQALSGQQLRVSQVRAAIAELCSVPEGSIRLVKPEGGFLEDTDLYCR